LVKQNPQWSGETTDVPEFKRDLFPVVEKYLPEKQIIAIVGLRRVGKTVLIKQLVNSLKAGAKNICYMSFDDRDFQKYETAFELIEYFLQNTSKGTRYLFLDEIQKVPNWTDLLKTIYDTEKNLKIVISGSSSLEMKKYKETLAGRILTFQMPILSFREFTRYNGLEWKVDLDNLQREYDIKFLPKKSVYLSLFQKYLVKGAFPELMDKEDEDYIRKYISEVIDKIVADISKAIDPSKEKEIGELILLFCKSTGRVFEINNLSSVLRINRNTTSKYIDLLEKAFLLKVSYNYTKSVAKKLRISKKGYIAHSSIAISELQYPFAIISTDMGELGHLVETAIVGNLETDSFWSHQNREVDVILKDGTPVEIKYKNVISKGDFDGLESFMENHKAKKAIMITKDVFEREKIGGKEFLLVPAWLFLLTV